MNSNWFVNNREVIKGLSINTGTTGNTGNTGTAGIGKMF